jgi:hypothetical protein
MSIVVDGERGPVFTRVSPPAFGPDRRTVAYQAWEGEQSFVVLNDWRSPPFDWPLGDDVMYAPIVFSPNGSRVSYGGQEGEQHFVGLGDQRGTLFDGVDIPTFSPDGTIIAYVARDGGKQFVIVDDRRVGPFDKVGDLFFSPNSQQLAFLALHGHEVWWRVVDIRSPQSLKENEMADGEVQAAVDNTSRETYSSEQKPASTNFPQSAPGSG